jgi:hypothetical protein
MLIINKPFCFDSFREYVFTNDRVIVNIDMHNFKEAIVKDIRINESGEFEVKTEFGWFFPKWKIPYQEGLNGTVTEKDRK